MKIMQGNQLITIPELAHQLTISETAVQNNIAKLKAKGLLERIGPDKGGYWKVKQQKQ
jgi:ATP-dependent DNA helicase RecG